MINIYIYYIYLQIYNNQNVCVFNKNKQVIYLSTLLKQQHKIKTFISSSVEKAGLLNKKYYQDCVWIQEMFINDTAVSVGVGADHRADSNGGVETESLHRVSTAAA